MNATAIVNLIATLISSLAPVVSGLLAGGVSPEQAKAEAYAAIDALLSDLSAIRTRVLADDAAALAEVVGHALDK
jgi:hypothetical protein